MMTNVGPSERIEKINQEPLTVGVEERRSEIGANMAELDAEVSRLHKAVEAISEKLTPVLHQSPPMTNAELPVPEFSCSLAQELSGYVSGLRSASGQLESLFERIEL